jgi:hypothetical protein
VLEVQERGQGRLLRIFELLGSCGVSIHDLSRVGTPARFNMPFELGLACSLGLAGAPHEVVVLDSVPYRLDRTISDYKGRDPLIHHNRGDDLVVCIVDAFQLVREPSPQVLKAEARIFRRYAREIASQFGTLFRPAAFRTLVAASAERARQQGFIAP